MSTSILDSEGVKLVVSGLTQILSLFEKITSVAGGLSTVITTIVGVLAAKSPGFKFLPFQKVGEREVDGKTEGVYANIFNANSKRKELAIEKEVKSIEQSKKSWQSYINTVDEVYQTKQDLNKLDAKSPKYDKARSEYEKAKINNENARIALIEDENNKAYRGVFGAQGLDTTMDWEASKWNKDLEEGRNEFIQYKNDLKQNADDITKDRERILNGEKSKQSKSSKGDIIRSGLGKQRKALKEVKQHSKDLTSQNNIFNERLQKLSDTAESIVDMDKSIRDIEAKKNKIKYTKGDEKKKLNKWKRSELESLDIQRQQFEAAQQDLQKAFDEEKKETLKAMQNMRGTTSKISKQKVKNRRGDTVDLGKDVRSNIAELDQSLKNLDGKNVDGLKDGFAEVGEKANNVTKSIDGVNNATDKASKTSAEAKQGMTSAWDSVGESAKNLVKNIGATVAFDLALQGIMWAADKMIETSAEKIESMEAVVNDYNNTMNEITENTSKIKSVATEFNTLSQGVDENGRNIGLSAEQYERYNDIVNELVAINPELVKGYTAEGQAILDKNTAIAESIKLQKEAVGLATKEYLSVENGEKIYKGFKAKQEKQLREINQLFDKYSKSADTKGTIGNIDSNKGLDKETYDYLKKMEKEQGDLTPVEKLKYSLDRRHESLAKVADEYGKNSDQYKEELTKWSEVQTKYDVLQKEQQDMVNYLHTYVSTATEYGGVGLKDLISDEHIVQYKKGLESIASNTDLTFEEMQARAKSYTETMNKILNNTDEYSGKTGIEDEIEALDKAKEKLQNSDFSEGALDAYDAQVKSQVDSIRGLADQYKQSAPEIASALNEIASSYEDYSRRLSVVDALKGTDVGLDAARTQWEQHEQVAGLPDYTTAIQGYKKIYDSIFEGLNAKGEGSNTFWDGAERILGTKKLEELDYNLDKVKAKIKEIKDGGGFTAGDKTSSYLDSQLQANADKINKIKKGMVDTKTGDLNIDPRYYQQVADILGVSKEYFVSMVDNARQFGGLEFNNIAELENSMRQSDEYVKSMSNSDLGYYSWQQLVKDGREAGLSMKEIAKKKDELEKSGKIKIVNFTNLEESLAALKDMEGIFNEENNTFDFENMVTQMNQMGATTEDIQAMWTQITDAGNKKNLFTTKGVVDTELNSEKGAQKRITEIQAELNKTTDPTVGAVNESTNELKGISSKLDKIILQNGGNVDHEVGGAIDAAQRAQDNFRKNPNDSKSYQEYLKQLDIIKERREELNELEKDPTITDAQKKHIAQQKEYLDQILATFNKNEIYIKAAIKIDGIKNKDDILKRLGIEEKKVVRIQTLFDQGRLDEYEDALAELPPEVQTAVRAIVESKDKDNIKLIEGKLYEIDGDTATCIFSADANDVGNKYKYSKGKIGELDKTSSTSDIKANNKNALTAISAVTKGLGTLNGSVAHFSISGTLTSGARAAIDAVKKALREINGSGGGGGKKKGKKKGKKRSAHGTQGRRRGKNPVYGSAANGLNWQGIKPRASKYESGQTLVGELGQELVWSSRKGYAYLAGQYSPEIVHLDKGDVVYPADETRRILAGRSSHQVFGSMAFGNLSSTHSSSDDSKKKKKKKKKTTKKKTSKLSKAQKKANEKKASAYDNAKDILDYQLEMGYISEKTYYKKLVALYKKHLKGRKGMGKEIRQSLEDQKKAWIDAYNYEKGLLDHNLEMGKISYSTYYKSLDKLGKKYYKGRKGYGDEWRQHEEEMLRAAKSAYDHYQQKLDEQIEEGLISADKYYTESDKLRKKYLSNKGLKDENAEALKNMYSNYLEAIERYIDEAQQKIDDKDLFDAWAPGQNAVTDLKSIQVQLNNYYKSGKLKTKDYERLWMELERQIKQAQDEVYNNEKDHLDEITDMVENMLRQEAEDRIEALEKSVDKYQEIINKKKEALELTQKELSFQEDMADLATKIAKKQAEVDVLSRDTSRAGKAKYNKALEELNELIKEQDKTIRDETISQTQDNLDKQSEKYSELVEKQIEKIQEWLDDQKAVLDKVFEQIDNKETNNLLDRLLQYNMKHGDGLKDTVDDYWKQLSDLLNKYNKDIASIAKLLRDATKEKDTGGKVPVVKKHTGLKTGFVGDKSSVKQNERFALLTNDELVLSTADQKRLSEQIKISDSLIKAYRSAPSLGDNLKSVNNSSNIKLVNNTNINIDGNVDKDIMKKLESYGDMISDKTLSRIGDALNIKGVSPSQRINVYKR